MTPNRRWSVVQVVGAVRRAVDPLVSSLRSESPKLFAGVKIVKPATTGDFHVSALHLGYSRA